MLIASWKRSSRNLALSLFLAAGHAFAANSSTVSFASLSITESGKLTRTPTTASVIDSGTGLYVSCNTSSSPYGYTCGASTYLTFTVNFNGVTSPSYLKVWTKSSSASSFTVIPTSQDGTSYGATASINMSVAMSSIAAGQALPTTSLDSNVTVTFEVSAETASSATTPSSSIASFNVTFDGAPDTVSASSLPTAGTGVYAEPGDGKILLDAVTVSCTSCKYLFIASLVDPATVGAGLFSSATAADSASVGAVKVIEATTSDITEITGLTNGVRYYLTYAQTDLALNVDITNGGYVSFSRTFTPNPVLGVMDANLSCFSASIGGPGGTLEFSLWAMLMAAIFLALRRVPPRAV